MGHSEKPHKHPLIVLQRGQANKRSAVPSSITGSAAEQVSSAAPVSVRVCKYGNPKRSAGYDVFEKDNVNEGTEKRSHNAALRCAFFSMYPSTALLT